MNDFLITRCSKCEKWHPPALSCVIVELQEEARKAFDDWFYPMYFEMRKKELTPAQCETCNTVHAPIAECPPPEG